MVSNILQKLRPVAAALAKLWPSKAVRGKLMPVFGMVAVGVLAYFWGRQVARAPAQERGSFSGVNARPTYNSDYDKRVVAYIYDNMPITREELGEFLISRFGAERLEFLVNCRIVELACKAKGIQVTDAMVEAQLTQDLKALNPNMTRKDFTDHILSRVKKTLYEYKEDAIRPRLMLAQYCAPMIQVTEEDVQKAYEGRYGPKVECRWLVLPDNNQKFAIWEKVRTDEKEFNLCATTINNPQLAAVGGKMPPIHKHFGDPRIEQAAFNLKVGEVSPLIGMSDGTVVILKCDKHIPADLATRLETVRLALMEETRNYKLNQKVAEVMVELRKNANPKLLLRHETRQDDLERAVLPEINGQATPTQRSALPAVPKVGG